MGKGEGRRAVRKRNFPPRAIRHLTNDPTIAPPIPPYHCAIAPNPAASR